MNKEKCLVCNFFGQTSYDVTPNYLFQQGQERRLHLCYGHSVELFKMGQANFLVKYRESFHDHGIQTNSFLDRERTHHFTSYYR